MGGAPPNRAPTDPPLGPDHHDPRTDAAAAEPLLGGFGRGVGWTYLSLLLTGVATLLLAAWSVRRVGTAQFGLFALVTSITGLLTIFDYALGLAVQRSSARVEAGLGGPGSSADADDVHAAHGACVLLGAAGVVSTAIACGLVAAFGPTHRPYLVPIVALLGLATSAELATAALAAVSVGSRLFSARCIATTAGVAVRVVVTLATVGRIGVAGLGLGLLVGIVVERLVLLRLVRTRVRWFVVTPRWPASRPLRNVTGYGVPLVLLNLSGQLLAVSDFVAVGVLVNARAVGVYEVASMLPMYMLGVLMLGYNVIFPFLAGTDNAASQEAATTFLTRVCSYVGATGLVLAAALRHDVVAVVLGQPSALAEQVLVIFSALCMVYLMLHGLSSLLIARGYQGLLSRVVAIELPVNLVLTVVFVLTFGAAGAAAATLTTVVLVYFVVFPVISRGHFARPALEIILRDGLVPAALGGMVALVSSQAATLLGTPAVRLLAGSALAGCLAVGAGLLLLGTDGRRTLRDAV